MNFLDLFAGIGGFRLGMETAGHKCIGYCEIDKFARASYKAIHDTKGEIELHDITTVSDEFIQSIGHVDVICGGFPCQAFSIAGNRRGFEDTRGTLFFEIARFAKDFGVPQNRERVFIIGHLRGTSERKIFPIGGENEKLNNQQSKIEIVGNTKNPLETQKGTKYVVYSTNGIVGALTATDYKEPKQVAIPVLTPDRVNKRQNGRRFKEDGEPMFTLTAQDKHGIMIVGKLPGNHSQTSRVYSPEGLSPTITTMTGGWHEPKIKVENYRIRKLTPKECWRLQGFPDWAFEKAAKVNSNSQLYKQAGNSVTVNVIKAIALKLK